MQRIFAAKKAQNSKQLHQRIWKKSNYLFLSSDGNNSLSLKAPRPSFPELYNQRIATARLRDNQLVFLN